MTAQSNPTRMWAVLLVGLSAIVGLGLLLTFLGRGPGESSPLVAEPTATQPGDVPVATVNGEDILYSTWVEAALLDQVMSDLSGQPAPTPDDSLQRLINERLVLSAFPPQESPTDDQVEARITALEQSWDTDDEAVQTALEQVGLTRASLEQAVKRLLEVERSLEEMEAQGYDATEWIAEQRAAARVELDDALVNSAVPRIIAQVQAARAVPSPEPTKPPTNPPTKTPSPEPPGPTPKPTAASEAAALEVAPDFSLPQAGGGTFTLTEQLKQGPVVLVFFQKCG